MKKVVVYCLLLFVVGFSYAQNTRTAESPKVPKPQYQSQKKQKSGFFSLFQKKTKKQSDKSEIEEFRSRLKRVYKEKAKEEKLADKKRYKEHGYFGHKKPPKKRPPEKMKYCKVCQLKH